MHRGRKHRLFLPLVTLVALAVAITAADAPARSALAPENLGQPSLSGRPIEGSTLTATKGLWANSPTSFVFKWQRCDTDGTACSRDVQTGPKNEYTIVAADVGHTIRVVVYAVNGDGRSEPAPSNATDAISSKAGPKNTAPPTISGDATEGQQLTVSSGTWAPTNATYTYQWQRCDAAADSTCSNILLAHQSSYTVRSSDVGSKLRVLVTAKTAKGSTSVYTAPTEYVQSSEPTPTVNQAPTLQFLSLIRIGRRTYARFRVCDDGLGRITVVERDTKAGALAYTRRYSVYTYASCGTFSRSWTPAPRFRTRGRMTVTLQAVDKSQKKSTVRSKSVSWRL
jgi:hypothetical protein